MLIELDKTKYLDNVDIRSSKDDFRIGYEKMVKEKQKL